ADAAADRPRAGAGRARLGSHRRRTAGSRRWDAIERALAGKRHRWRRWPDQPSRRVPAHSTRTHLDRLGTAMHRSLIVAKIVPGSDREVAEIWAESDATELPRLAGVRH